MAERRARPQPVFSTETERLAEAARRKRARTMAVFAVLLTLSALLCALTLVKLTAAS